MHDLLLKQYITHEVWTLTAVFPPQILIPFSKVSRTYFISQPFRYL